MNDMLAEKQTNPFDSLGSNIEKLFSIISDNFTNLDRKVPKNEAEEILKKFK